MTLTQPDGTWRLAAFAGVFGAVAALGQAPWGAWPATLLGLWGMFWLLKAATTARRAGWIGWATGTGYFVVALFWIIEPFLVDIARHGWMAPFALILMAGGFALFWGAAAMVAQRLGRPAAAMVVTLTAAELLRGIVFTGFPWAMIGHVWVGTAPMQMAAWGGAGLLTFFTFAIAACGVLARGRVVGIAVALLFLALGWAAGTVRLNQIDVAETDKIVRVVQPNAPQHLKWDPEHVPTFLRRQLVMSAEPADVPLNLIVWPETSVATRLDYADQIVPALADAAGGVPLIFGGNDVVEGRYRNALMLLDADGQIAGRYHKHHLVPFGEYIPLTWIVSALGIEGLTQFDAAGFEAGPGPALIEVDGVGRILPLICYELIFPRHMRLQSRPDLIVQITNDAWFGEISGPYQHLAQARLRAVEQGLGLVRSANTGVSAVIDPLGGILKESPLGQTGYFDQAVPAPLPPTLYSRLGDTLVWLITGLLLASLFAARSRKAD